MFAPQSRAAFPSTTARNKTKVHPSTGLIFSSPSVSATTAHDPPLFDQKVQIATPFMTSIYWLLCFANISLSLCAAVNCVPEEAVDCDVRICKCKEGQYILNHWRVIKTTQTQRNPHNFAADNSCLTSRRLLQKWRWEMRAAWRVRLQIQRSIHFARAGHCWDRMLLPVSCFISGTTKLRGSTSRGGEGYELARGPHNTILLN